MLVVGFRKRPLSLNFHITLNVIKVTHALSSTFFAQKQRNKVTIVGFEFLLAAMIIVGNC